MGKTRDQHSNNVLQKIVKQRKSEEQFKKISKQLKIPFTTIKALMMKLKVTGDVKNQLGGGLVFTSIPCATRRMFQLAKKISPRISAGKTRKFI